MLDDSASLRFIVRNKVTCKELSLIFCSYFVYLSLVFFIDISNIMRLVFLFFITLFHLNLRLSLRRETIDRPNLAHNYIVQC